MRYKYLRRFAELGIDDVPIVGGKNASLGEMFSALTSHGIKVPNGFATTADAFRYFLQHNDLAGKIGEALAALPPGNIEALPVTGAKIRQWIMRGTLPADFADELRQGYADLAKEYGPSTDVAVRSSATAEDLPTASFAGQQETYLNIRGTENLLVTCKRVFASLFTDRAISYRNHKGFSHMDVALSIGVQKMVRSDLASAGVIFTLDTESGFRDVVFITSAYGLGENVVQGAVNPDEFYVFKPTLKTGCRPIVKRQLGDKAIKMVYTTDAEAGHSTRNVSVHDNDRHRFSLTDDEVLTLARYACVIEDHYSAKAGKWRPMDIEWAKDGVSNELFIVQARPETVKSTAHHAVQTQYRLATKGTALAQGKSVGQKVAAGRARLILEASHMHQLQPGEILVTDITDPDWEPVMKIAGAIVTNRGGRTCHAAIVARELGIPAVVGCGNATQKVPSGEDVTVSCAEGDAGFVYKGKIPYTTEAIQLDDKQRPRTAVMMNVGNPERAMEVCQIPNDGVGLARLEFIINSAIGVHPHALLDYDNLSAEVRAKIDVKRAGYPDPQSFYIDKLAEGVGTIAAAFYPRQVIVRLSDFKSNEYAELIGGADYEPHEENPMIGFRGASRYPSEQFAACFAMECAAMLAVRNDMGLKNVALMIPFVRSVTEATSVLEMMGGLGLRRGVDGLKIYMMCEIPANALLAEAFLAHFDGFSIGSNDLTQLTLGVDRDSGLLAGFDERNEAVLQLMDMAISACKRLNKYVGICGQAPSDYPEIARWLVRKGIHSISLNPDSVVKITRVILDTEKELN